MKSQKYYELVRRYEREAKQHPERFQRRTRRYIWIGYAYISLVLLLMVGATGLASLFVYFRPHLYTIGGLIFVAFFTWDLLATLFAKHPQAEGVRLVREEFPLLFQEVDELRTQMDVPDIHEVVLCSDFNAFASESRSRFLVGKKRRTLGLGMPLLETMNVEEFRTILGHEVAHLARGHTKLHAMVWHLRNVWLRILGGGEVSFWWRWFAKFYADRFEAMTAVISREFEFEADRIASEVRDKHSNISAHLKMELMSSVYDVQHSEWINSLILDDPQVPANAISAYCDRIKRPIDPAESAKHLRRILAVETSIYLTHPSCRERIAMDGFSIDRPLDEMVQEALGYVGQSSDEELAFAADYFLGVKREELLRKLDQQYVLANKQVWAQRSEFISQYKEQLKVLEQRIGDSEAAGTKPEEADLLARANVLYEILDQKSISESYEKVLEHYPENPTALFVKGQYAYQREFDLVKAESCFTRSVESNPRLEYDVSSYMIALCRELEKSAEAERWQQYSFGALDALNDSRDERATVKLNDKFISADISEQQIDKIVEQIAAFEQVAKVWVACKKLEVYSETPLYLLGIETNDFLKFRSMGYYDSLGISIANTVDFGNEYFLIMLQGENKKFRKKFKKLESPLCIDMAARRSSD